MPFTLLFLALTFAAKGSQPIIGILGPGPASQAVLIHDEKAAKLDAHSSLRYYDKKISTISKEIRDEEERLKEIKDHSGDHSLQVQEKLKQNVEKLRAKLENLTKERIEISDKLKANHDLETWKKLNNTRLSLEEQAALAQSQLKNLKMLEREELKEMREFNKTATYRHPFDFLKTSELPLSPTPLDWFNYRIIPKLLGSSPSLLFEELTREHRDHHPTRMYQVSCETRFLTCNRVNVPIGVDLSNADLTTGVLPSELCNVKQLMSVNLAHNKLTGTVPSCLFSEMPMLDTLILDNNELSGDLVCGKQSHLVHLSAANNMLNGTFPQSFPDSLLTFNIQSNSVSGTIPAELGFHMNLELFNVADNRLTGVLPTEMLKMDRHRTSCRVGRYNRETHTGNCFACHGGTNSEEKYKDHILDEFCSTKCRSDCLKITQ